MAEVTASQPKSLSKTDSHGHNQPKKDRADFSIVPRDYDVYVQMGHACNGSASIYVGKHAPTGHFVAIRKVSLENCSLEFEDLAHEITMHRIFNCEYILDYLCTFVSGETLWIVMPLQGYGSCMDMMQAHFHYGLPELVIALILKQVLQALVYLHGCGVIHRSLRASHILVSESGKVVVSGLRNCYLLERHGIVESKCRHYPTNSSKAINYYSPELLSQDLHGYNQKSDIYSLGVVACELANGHTPFATLKNYEILYEKLEGNMPRLLDSTTTSFAEDSSSYSSKTFSPDFHEFAEICCSHSEDERPTAEELLRHRFFNQTRKISYDQLPKMLEPLTPLTSVLLNHKDIGANSNVEHQEVSDLSNVTNDMALTSITDLQWDF